MRPRDLGPINDLRTSKNGIPLYLNSTVPFVYNSVKFAPVALPFYFYGNLGDGTTPLVETVNDYLLARGLGASNISTCLPENTDYLLDQDWPNFPLNDGRRWLLNAFSTSSGVTALETFLEPEKFGGKHLVLLQMGFSVIGTETLIWGSDIPADAPPEIDNVTVDANYATVNIDDFNTIIGENIDYYKSIEFYIWLNKPLPYTGPSLRNIGPQMSAKADEVYGLLSTELASSPYINFMGSSNVDAGQALEQVKLLVGHPGPRWAKKVE
jgi:hypothetical protein